MSDLNLSTFTIPSRPDVLLGITEEVRKPDPDIDVICHTLKQDVALFSAVIATINSPLFGLPQKITSVERAVSLLGLKRTFHLVRLAALKNSLATTGPMERFWDTATEVASISESLAKHLTKLNSDDAYTLGMLHDCGIPLMMIRHTDFKDMLRELNGASLITSHQQQIAKYGYSHYQVGAELTRSWNIGDNIAEAIARQPLYLDTFAEPADNDEDMRLKLCLLLVSKDISEAYRHYWRVPNDKEQLIQLRSALDFLGLSEPDYLDLKDDIVTAMACDS